MTDEPLLKGILIVVRDIAAAKESLERNLLPDGSRYPIEIVDRTPEYQSYRIWAEAISWSMKIGIHLSTKQMHLNAPVRVPTEASRYKKPREYVLVNRNIALIDEVSWNNECGRQAANLNSLLSSHLSAMKR